MDGFERRKAQSREEILAAAARLFARFGIDKASVADIAREAGLAPATIYNNFGTKEALVREVARGMIESLAAEARAALAAASSFPERLELFFRFVAERYEGQGLHGFSPERGLLELELGRDPELRRVKELAREGMLELLLGIAREARAAGELEPGADEEAVALYLSAFLELFTSRDFLERCRARPELLPALRDLVARGLGTLAKPGKALD